MTTKKEWNWEPFAWAMKFVRNGSFTAVFMIESKAFNSYQNVSKNFND